MTPTLRGGAHELDRAVHGPMVGQRERRLAQLGGARGQLADATQAVQQRILAMYVQMDEIVGHSVSYTSAMFSYPW